MLFGIDLDHPEAIRTIEVVLTKSAVIVQMRPRVSIYSDWKLSLGRFVDQTFPTNPRYTKHDNIVQNSVSVVNILPFMQQPRRWTKYCKLVKAANTIFHNKVNSHSGGITNQ